MFSNIYEYCNNIIELFRVLICYIYSNLPEFASIRVATLYLYVAPVEL